MTEEQLDLASRNIAELSPETRLDLLSNAWTTVRRHLLKPDALLRFLPSLDSETHREVIDEVADVLMKIRDLIDDEAAEPSFDAYVLARMARHKHRFGLDRSGPTTPLGRRKNGEDAGVALLRRELLWILGSLGDKDVLPAAEGATARWLASPTEPLDPNVGEGLLQIASRRAAPATVEGLMGQLERPARPENRSFALAALGRVQDAATIRRTLDRVLAMDLKPHQVNALLWRLASIPRTRQVLFDWIAAEWKRIREKWATHAIWPVLSVVERACNDSQREALVALFHDAGDDEAWFKERVADAVICRDLKEFGGAAVVQELRRSGVRRGAPQSPTP